MFSEMSFSSVFHFALKLACSCREILTVYHECYLVHGRHTERDFVHACLNLYLKMEFPGLMKYFLPQQWAPVFISLSPTWFSEAWFLLKLQWWGLNAHCSSCLWLEVLIQDSVFSLRSVVIEQGTICSLHVSLGRNYSFMESGAAKAAVLALLGHVWERPLQKVILSLSRKSDQAFVI